MAVTFVIGRAGSGKTSHCFRAIIDAIRHDPLGPPIYWLLPRQATFTAERELTCTSGLDAFIRARVVSFEEFGRDVFDDCGGSSIPQVTALGRQMILGHLLRQNRSKLRFFSRVARQPGLAAELDATFAEFERSGKSSAELSEFITELSESNAADLELAPLLDKLRDTHLLYNAYTAYLGQERLDQHGRMAQVQASLSNCSFLKQSTMYVDGFLDFTEYERRTIVGAAKAGAAMQITLLMDPASRTLADPHILPDEMSLFRRTEETYRKLYFALTEENVVITEPIRLERLWRFRIHPTDAVNELNSKRNPPETALGDLERSLFRDPIHPSSGASGIEMIEAPDRRSEVDAAARSIQSLVMKGLRLREIGVLVRDLAQYHSLIDASFREHGIPYFVDRRRTAAHHPLLQFLRSIFQIARNDWPQDAIMSLLRSGLAGVTLYEADGLENYVLAHRIHGAEGWEASTPWDYRRRLLATDGAAAAVPNQASQAQALRQSLLDKLRSLLQKLRDEEPLLVRDMAAEIFATIDRFDIRTTLGQWAHQAADDGHLEQSAEHEQVWTNLTDLFDQLVELLGQERMTPAEFHDVLESGLDGFDLALTPPTVDQVLVGQVDRTRSLQLKAAFVLGMNEGEFPRVSNYGSILTDRDRRTLRSRRIDLDPGLQQRLLDERLLGYIAMTRASDLLFISRPMADDEGRSTGPSSFWQRIIELLPQVTRITLPPGHDPRPSDIATPRQLVTSLMRWVRGSADPATTTETAWPALYQWLASRTDDGSRIALMRARAWPALGYANDASLSPDVAGQMFSSPLEAGVSQMETFAACPFQHFARYGLGLRGRERQEVTAQDMGRLYHDLLESSLKEVLQRRAAGDRTVTLESVLDKYVSQIGGNLRHELMLGSARNRYLLERTRRTLQQIARAQREVLKRGLFRPAHVGTTFGPGGKLPALRIDTPSGGEVFLHGKIDRIDRVESTGDAAVIDYRLGSAKLPVGMVHHGLSLQLLSYLLVLQSNGQKLSGRDLEPAAAFYLQLLRRIEDVKHPDESQDPDDPKWYFKLKPRGIFDRRCLAALDKELEAGPSDVVQAFITKDGNLGHRNTSDVAETEDFRSLLRFVSAKLGELADGIIAGRIDVLPYRLNDNSPCPRCDYRGLCRFDPAINKYNYLKVISREERVAEAGKGGG